MKTFFICLFLMLTTFINASHEPVTPEEMCDHISGLGTMIQARYGSAWWKEELFQWNLENEVHNAKVKILQESAPSLVHFRKAVAELFRSMNDYHVDVRFYNTEKAFLPFTVKLIGEKILITDVDAKKYPSGQPKLSPGDQLIRFNGKPAKEAVEEIFQLIQRGTKETDLALACMDFTSRQASSGLVVPQGKVDLVVLSRSTQKESKIQLKWDYRLELITEPPVAMLAEKEEPSSPFRILNQSLLQERNTFSMRKDPLNIGSREAFFPKLGKVIWESSQYSFAHAYIFQTSSGDKIGYLRIPHYLGEGEEMEELEDVIERLQRETKALVLDQTNNPGGSVLFCYGVASLLTDKPLRNLTETVVLTQEEVFHAHAAVAEFDLYKKELQKDFQRNGPIIGLGYYIDWDVFSSYIESERFLTKEWAKKKLLTDHVAIWGQKQIKPHPYSRYTKPILMLINELDFSCGDILPALLQDNHRATLMGVRTAGAGGHVRSYKIPNRLAIRSITLTGSIGYRADGEVLENNGVKPDISLEITEKDLYDSYSDYVNAVQEAVQSLLNK